MEQRKHWPQVETLYVLGIALVLFGHSHSSDWSAFQGTVLERAIRFVYTFHMPLFFFLAGFLFQNSDALERRGYGGWIGDKALRLLVPYGFWTLAALVPKYYLEHGGLDGLTPAFALRTLFVPRSNIWGHFWFIPVLFLAYALFGAVRTLARRAPDRVLLPVLAAVCLGAYFLPVGTKLFGLADLKSALVFFAFGMLFRAYFPAERLRAALQGGTARWAAVAAVLIGTVLAVLLWRSAGEDPFAALAVALGMILLCWLVGELVPPGPGMKWLAAHNFSIYIFSWIFQAAVMMVCDKLHFSWIATFFCMFFVGLAGPVALVALCERIPLLKKRVFRLILGLR